MQQLYNEIHYPPLTHSETHPDRLAVVGKLMGLHPPSPERCTVLDIGCGNGANVIAMAELLPEAHFVGIDYAASQIEDGKDILRHMGLTNVDLQAVDIMDLPDKWGSFDYVIAHGFYSWVKEPMRRKAMRLIRESMTPEGLAFISFNAYPGWHHVEPLRDMMLYRGRGIEDPAERVHAARAFIAMAADAQDESSVFGAFIKQYASTFYARGSVPESQMVSTLLYDEMNETNQPFYFYQFAEAIRADGLEVLVEADLEGSTPIGLDNELVKQLTSFSHDHIEMEQYVDFIRNRMFRRVLVCHPDAPIQRHLDARSGVLNGMFLSAQLKEEPDEDEPGKQRFTAADGLSFSTERPLLQAAYRRLSQLYPEAVRFEDLAAHAAEATGSTEAEAAAVLGPPLLRNFLYGRSLLELHTAPRPLVTQVSDRPRTTAFVREMIRRGVEAVANVRHERVRITGKSRPFLPILDGEHDIVALQEATRNGGSEPLTEAEVRGELQWLARIGMLLA